MEQTNSSNEWPNILIVDNRPGNLLAAGSMLEGMEINVITATSGRDALKRLLDKDFALIMLDVDMPVMNGFELAETIKQSPRTRHIPIVFFTLTGKSEEQMHKGYEIGAVDYILKPFPKEALRAKVTVYLDLYRSRRELMHVQERLKNFNRAIEREIMEKRGALWRAEEKYYNIFRNAIEGIFQISSDMKFISANPALARILGYDSPLVLMAETTDIGRLAVVPDRLGELLHLLAEKGDVADFEMEVYRRDRRKIWISMNARAPRNEAGTLACIEGSISDITERREAEERLRETLLKLEESNKDLEQFAHIVSHDLKEPLAVVGGYIDLLSRRYAEKLDKDAAEFIDSALEGANHMQQLIDDLFEYSRVGTVCKPFEPTDLNLALRQATENLKFSIAENDAVVSNDHLPTVMADEVQIVRLFQNLIGNAIKYHDNKPPLVNIATEQKGKEWLIRVSDNGIGIDPDSFGRIFIPFQRLHTEDKYPGTGIGLAICRKIVERHGGRIWVESHPGAGSTFLFTLPSV